MMWRLNKVQTKILSKSLFYLEKNIKECQKISKNIKKHQKTSKDIKKISKNIKNVSKIYKKYDWRLKKDVENKFLKQEFFNILIM